MKAREKIDAENVQMNILLSLGDRHDEIVETSQDLRIFYELLTKAVKLEVDKQV